jgi:wyosine [tRNA(Phe)-imidazoG37] synthetase (radical SAM superfamily)
MIVKGREVKVDMQRRHLELIAQVVNQIGMNEVNIETVAMMFADKLQREAVNVNFDVQRFIKACMGEQ